MDFVTLYESWSPTSAREEMEVCLLLTSDSQYILQMNGEWGWNSYLEIRGPYGNTVFKSVWWDYTFYFSLDMPVKKGSSWKWSTELTPLWYESHISSWEDSISGEYEKTDATHYFTIPFNGLADMAAYEMKFLYRYGIVTYINGVEVYRDHLPAGLITPTTKSTGSYSTYDYYGTIRNGYEVSGSNIILAVEIHTNGETAIRFDGWLALYQLSDVSISTLKCYPIQPTIVMVNSGFDAANTIDWDVETAISISSISPGTDYIEYTIPVSQPNYLYMLLTPSYNYIRTMQFRHQDMISGDYTSPFDGSVTAQDTDYFTVRMGNHRVPNTRKFRVFPMSATGMPAVIFEQLPRVCNIAYEMDLIYPEFIASYSFAVGTQVNILPTGWDAPSSCESIPALPKGLTFTKCSITGVPSTVSEATTYTILIYDEMGTKATSITLEITSSSGGGGGGGDDDGDNQLIPIIVLIIVVILVIILVIVILLLRSHKPANPKPIPMPKSPGDEKEGGVSVEMIQSSVVMNGDMSNVSAESRYSVPLEDGSSTPYDNRISGTLNPLGTPGYSVALDPLGTPNSNVMSTPMTDDTSSAAVESGTIYNSPASSYVSDATVQYNLDSSQDPLPENYPLQDPPQINYPLPENYPHQDPLQNNYPLTFPNPLERTINSDDPAIITVVSNTEYQQEDGIILIDSNTAQPGDSEVEVQNIQPEDVYRNAGGISLLGQIPGIY